MNYRFILPLLTTAVLEQTVVTIVRVTTTLSGGGARPVGGLARRHLRRHRRSCRCCWRSRSAATSTRATRRGPPMIGAGLLCISCGGFARVAVADRPADLHRAARARPPDAGHQPADPVRHRSDAGRARAQHRQLHGRQCDRAGARPLHRRLCRRRRQRAADAVAVHGRLPRLVRDVRGVAAAAAGRTAQAEGRRNPIRCRCAISCACRASA